MVPLPLVTLFTLIDKTGTVPDTWINAVVVPVIKKGDPKSAENYCTVSLLSIVGIMRKRKEAQGICQKTK